MLDEWIDTGIATLTSIPPMFGAGWGDWQLLCDLTDRAATPPVPPPIDVHWTDKKRGRGGVRIWQGQFRSPNDDIPLPDASKTAHFRLLLPPPDATDRQPDRLPPVCIHLAGTGDSTYFARQTLAAPLARSRGIGALILQTPFYGERKPEGQSGTRLRQFTDQLMMTMTAVQESRALLRWMKARGHNLVGVTGYSMGGFLAAITAQLSQSHPLAVIPCAAGNSPSFALTDSPLQRIIDWERLAAELPDDVTPRELMRDLMDSYAIDKHGSLDHPELAILVAATNDAFIPTAEVEKLHAHWPGSELRWLRAGHTTGWVLNASTIRRAIADAFERLKVVVPDG